jgi:F-type H+-transporting ATP synthase subunit e
MQVLRWSALGLGIFYGFSHQRSINATQKAAHDKHEFEKKQKAIDAAKAEFAKRHPVPSSGSKDLVTDPSDPKFDLEKLLLKVSEDKA